MHELARLPGDIHSVADALWNVPEQGQPFIILHGPIHHLHSDTRADDRGCGNSGAGTRSGRSPTPCTVAKATIGDMDLLLR